MIQRVRKFRLLAPPVSNPPDMRRLAGSAWEPLAGSTPVTLATLDSGMCKWPLGEAPFLFCGAPAGDGSYCGHHAAMSVGRGTESERVAHRAREMAPC